MKNKYEIPSAEEVLPTVYKSSCFIKNVIKAPNVIVGDYTYYDEEKAPTDFEKNNILFNYPAFGDKLIIGKFCAIASGTQFIMGAANHRMNSVSTYPFNIFGGTWAEKTAVHMEELPHKGDTVIGNDVWFGRECLIMPGITVGDGAIIGARSVVAKDIPPYAVACGNPAKVVKMRFDDELIKLLSELKWWDLPLESLTEFLPNLTSPNLETVKIAIKNMLRKKSVNLKS